MAATIPGTAMMAMLCFVALALPADAVISGRNCTGVSVWSRAGKELLNGEHLRIGFVDNGVGVKCCRKCDVTTGNTNACAWYGSIDRETNKEHNVWTGFDIDLIEELGTRELLLHHRFHGQEHQYIQFQFTGPGHARDRRSRFR